MEKVIGLGAGGHAKVVLDILRQVKGYEVVGFLDPKQELWGAQVCGVPVLGDDRLLSQLYDQGLRHTFIGLGSVGDTRPRQRLYDKARQHGFEIVSAIHPHAVVAYSARIGRGATIMAGAVINPDATLGDNVIVNTGAIVEHDCIIGDHVHIATGARLASTVRVGEGTHIGIGATVRQSITIGRGVVVAAGAVVVKNVPDHIIVAGVPARLLRDLRSTPLNAGPKASTV